MPSPGLDPEVAAIRAFNRLYTRKIGVVDGIASSPFSLAEARVLFELAPRAIDGHRHPQGTWARRRIYEPHLA